jgi:lipopolysaccharide export system permease protein
MPRLLTLYIVRSVLGMTAIVAMAMLAIHSFITLVTEADDIGRGGFGVWQLAQTTFYQLPSGLALLMPIVAMIGALMGLGALGQQSELTAMRAAGFSNGRIALATLIAGAILGVLGWYVGDVLAPRGERAADAVRAAASGDSAASTATIWLRDGQDVLRIRRLIAADQAEAVDIYRLSADLKLQALVSADAARWQSDHWQLEGVRTTRFATDGHVEARQQPQDDWQGTVTPNVLELYLLEANALSITGLSKLIAYLDDNHLDAVKYRLQRWKKLIEPLTIMAMAAFAVPFAFGSLRDSGAGQRLLVGILLGVGFYVVNRVSLSLGQLYAWVPVLAAGGPTVLWAAIAAWRIRRTR